MLRLKTVACRQVLNSHVQFTNEFTVTTLDGTVGVGTSPAGETISIYEVDKSVSSPELIVGEMQSDNCFDREWTQEEFDSYVEARAGRWGRNNVFALSLSFFQAALASGQHPVGLGTRVERMEFPRLCLNILNGGWHAYTNPVLSDFHEYLLVATTDQPEEAIGMHNEIQGEVRSRLKSLPLVDVDNNPVHQFATRDNRECIEFLLHVRDDLGFTRHFDLMIDASAGDLWHSPDYCLRITDGTSRSSAAFVQYWQGLIDEFDLRYLEDPFSEEDRVAWRELAGSQNSCYIIGDNFYSSDPIRIQQGALEGCTHGVILKPNQAGTVSRILQAVKATQREGQIPITSHRSVSTEETFLSFLTCYFGVDMIKIGPLYSDYSSVLRFNAMLRLTEH